MVERVPEVADTQELPLHDYTAAPLEPDAEDCESQESRHRLRASAWVGWTKASAELSNFNVAVRVLLLVTCWWTAAIGVTLVMKRTVAKTDELEQSQIFPYPFALTGLTNTTTSLLALVLCSLLRLRQSAPLIRVGWGEAAQLAALGGVQGLELGCNNKALEYLPLSARTLIGSAGVLCTMAFAGFAGLERTTTARLASGLLLATGAAMQVLDQWQLEHTHGGQGMGDSGGMWACGLLLQWAAMLVAALRWVLLQGLLQRVPKSSPLGRVAAQKLQLTARTLPFTAAVCFGLSLCFEAGALMPQHLLQPSLLGRVLFIAGGITALTLSELEIVRLTSAVAVQVLMIVHQIPLALAGVLVFHDHISFPAALGFLLSLTGALFYTRIRCEEAPEKLLADGDPKGAEGEGLTLMAVHGAAKPAGRQHGPGSRW